MINTPPTTEALLPSEGIRKATVHTYVRSERAAYITAEGTVGGLGTAHVYRCTETGRERRWGFDS